MHKFIAALFGLLSAGCSGIKVPDDFAYKEIETRDFKLASWQKISEPDGVYKFYIEGDGHAFDSRGARPQIRRRREPCCENWPSATRRRTSSIWRAPAST